MAGDCGEGEVRTNSIPCVSSVQLFRRLDEESKLRIGFGKFGDREGIRLVCVDPDLDRERVDEMIRLIKSVAEEVRNEDGGSRAARTADQ